MRGGPFYPNPHERNLGSAAGGLRRAALHVCPSAHGAQRVSRFRREADALSCTHTLCTTLVAPPALSLLRCARWVDPLGFALPRLITTEGV
jgi:hypothetical protein